MIPTKWRIFVEEVKLSEFGRRGILTLRQNLAGRIMDIEKANVYAKYRERVDEILVGEVYQVWKRSACIGRRRERAYFT